MAALTDNDLAWVAANHPGLLIYRRPNSTVLEGTFSFNRTYNQVTREDEYKIRLEIRDDPLMFPIISETGGRFKSVLAAHPEFEGNPVHLHIYDNWRLCLAAPQELRLKYLPNPSLESLFETFITPYFYSQSYFEANQEWPWRHLPHNFDGILEWYRVNYELRGAVKETAYVIHVFSEQGKTPAATKMIQRARRNDSFSPRSKCLCGSKYNYLQCHPSYIKLAIPLRTKPRP